MKIKLGLIQGREKKNRENKMRYDNKQMMFQHHCRTIYIRSLSHMKLAPSLLILFYIVFYSEVAYPNFGMVHIKKAKALVCNELKSVNRVFSFLKALGKIPSFSFVALAHSFVWCVCVYAVVCICGTVKYVSFA